MMDKALLILANDDCKFQKVNAFNRKNPAWQQCDISQGWALYSTPYPPLPGSAVIKLASRNGDPLKECLISSKN